MDAVADAYAEARPGAAWENKFGRRWKVLQPTAPLSADGHAACNKPWPRSAPGEESPYGSICREGVRRAITLTLAAPTPRRFGRGWGVKDEEAED